MSATFTAVLALTITACIAVALHHWRSRGLIRQLREAEAQARAFEKLIHQNDAENLKVRNSLEKGHHEQIRTIREEAFQEGVSHGTNSASRDYSIELTKLQAAHREVVATREREVEQRSREAAKLDFETREKAFSVLIQPFVRVEVNDWVVWSSHKSEIGYQYQLMVNGIPAFQPHVVINQIDESTKIDKEGVRMLIEVAERITRLAVTNSFGGNDSMIKVGTEIVQEVRS